MNDETGAGREPDRPLGPRYGRGGPDERRRDPRPGATASGTERLPRRMGPRMNITERRGASGSRHFDAAADSSRERVDGPTPAPVVMQAVPLLEVVRADEPPRASARTLAERRRRRTSSAPSPSVIRAALLAAVVFVAGLAVGQAGAAPTSAPLSTPPSNVGAVASTPGGQTPGGSAGTAAPSTVAPGTPAAGAASPPSSPPPSSAATQPPSGVQNFGLFWEALNVLRERYVDREDVDPSDLTYGAIRGLVGAVGDEGHTSFLTPEERRRHESSLRGTIVGIGITLDPRSPQPVIVSVIAGSPASRAGLRPGDRIVSVGSRAAERLELQEVIELIRGPEGTTVRLGVVHRGAATTTRVSIVRAVVQVPAVSWTMVPGTRIVHIHIAQFSEGAGEQLRRALVASRQRGAQAVILDLRNDPGGLLVEAVRVASQFLEDGTVYIRQGADGNRTPVKVQPGGLATDTPLAVLVDFGSASSAEIVAGALQDAKRGPVIGVRTFGTGTLVSTFQLSDGSALQVGIERWLTPAGRRIFGEGITPGIRVELPADEVPLEPAALGEMTAAQFRASGDAQLLRAVRELQARP